MESILKEVITSFRLFLNFLKSLFTKGFYFTVLDKVENNYTALIFSSLIFYIIGESLLSSSFEVSLNYFYGLYERIQGNILENTIWNYLFKYFLLIVVINEIYSRILSKKIEERNFLLRFNYLTIAWFNILCSITLILLSLLAKYARHKSIEFTEEQIFPFAILLLIIYIGVPINTLVKARKNKVITILTIGKGVFLIIALLLSVKLIFTYVLKPIKGDNFFSLNSNKKIITVDSLKENNLLFKTSFIYENKGSENFILDTSKPVFYFGWTSYLFGKKLPEYSDTLEMHLDSTFNKISIEKGNPVVINLSTLVDTSICNKYYGIKNSKARFSDREYHREIIFFKTLNKGFITLIKSD